MNNQEPYGIYPNPTMPDPNPTMPDPNPTMPEASASPPTDPDPLDEEASEKALGKRPMIAGPPGTPEPEFFTTPCATNLCPLHFFDASRPDNLGACDTPENKYLREKLRLPPGHEYRIDSFLLGRLILAIQTADDNIVKHLMISRVDPNGGEFDPEMENPLYGALLSYGHWDDPARNKRCENIIKYLVFAGADLDIWFNGRTPLMILADKCQTTDDTAELMSIMLEVGPEEDVDASHGCQDRAALYRVVQQGRSSRAHRALEVLLQFKADPDLKPRSSRFSYVPMPIEVAMGNRDYKTAELLLEYGACPDHMGFMDQSHLFRATLSGDIEGMMLLLKHGANADITSEGVGNQIPLHEAVISQRLDAIHLLLGKCDVNAQDCTGSTSLSYAMETGNVAVILSLLNAGADPNVPIRNYDRGLYHWDLFHPRPKRMPWDVASAPIQHSFATVDTRERIYITRPIHEAIALESPVLFKALLDAGADMEVRDSTLNATPLLTACRLGHAEPAMMLIKRGVDVNCRDSESKTPLSYAQEYDNDSFSEVIGVLLECGGHL